MLVRQQAPSADRQTIIALRATHTAHRVASDVAYPKLPQAGADDPLFSSRRIVDPLEVLPYGRQPMPWRLRHLLIWFFILLTLAIALHLAQFNS